MTTKTNAQLQVIFADNTTGNITPQNMRDFSDSVYNKTDSPGIGTNASLLSSGTVPNARTTGATSSTASTLVLRDGSGSFSANTVGADFIIVGSSIGIAASGATSYITATAQNVGDGGTMNIIGSHSDTGLGGDINITAGGNQDTTTNGGNINISAGSGATYGVVNVVGTLVANNDLTVVGAINTSAIFDSSFVQHISLSSGDSTYMLLPVTFSNIIRVDTGNQSIYEAGAIGAQTVAGGLKIYDATGTLLGTVPVFG